MESNSNIEDRNLPFQKSLQRSGQAWYLDYVVAEHKRRTHLDLMHRWMGPDRTGRVLKTDLFEEANQSDQILFDPFFRKFRAYGFDLAFATVHRAKINPLSKGVSVWTADVRRLPLRSESVDWIISTSTLDHFPVRSDLALGLEELVRVLRPGGELILTMDNPHNPLYWGLRFASRLRYMPFPLGVTASLGQLQAMLHGFGLEVLGKDLLIHNPRGISTLLFMGVRRLCGERADRILDGLLRCFDSLGHLPTRKWTACFVAIHARKPRTPSEFAGNSQNACRASEI